MNNTSKKLIGLFAIVLTCMFSSAQGLVGTWNGSLHVQAKEFPIVFHISKDSAGHFIASFDSPSQNAFNLAVSEVITKEDSVILMMAILNGRYAGLVSHDKKTINGTWFQGPAVFPLVVTKTSDVATVKQLRRPQTPKPPFAYQTRDAEYWNADKTIHFGATLSYPTEDPAHRHKEGFPAVLLITGSGQQDRDETMVEHKPFAVIADNLTKMGFLVMRVDDRGIGKSTGNFSQATTLDFAKDVEAGLDFLEMQPEVDKEKIGLLGHSEGGLIAPIVAGERMDVKFIVLLAGPGIPTIDLMQQQYEAIELSVGRTPAEARASSGLLRLVMEDVNKSKDSVSSADVRMKADAYLNTLDSATVAKVKSRIGMPVDNYIKQVLSSMTSKWFRYFISLNPQINLQNLHCKVLALNGSRDVQVISGTNLEGIRASLKKSGSPSYDVVELPGLNHLFQTCVRCSPAEYIDLEETISPAALTAIDNWMSKNAK